MRLTIEKHPKGGWDVIDRDTGNVVASEPTRALARQSARQLRENASLHARNMEEIEKASNVLDTVIQSWHRHFGIFR